MRWFGISINSAISVSKFGLVAFAFVLGSVGVMSFSQPTEDFAFRRWVDGPGDTSISQSKIGFSSLFNDKTFSAKQPYAAQLNPRAVSFVQEYIKKNTKELTRMKNWGKPYFDLYDQILTQYGIPVEMKYLSVIESYLQPGLVSWAGAVGPWQLMDYEAKRYGLRTGTVDDRMDFTKSTHVAAKLMKELYAQFGDWLLVLAAYNGGIGSVKKAIRKSGSRDFWDLQYFLPEETRNHVKKFIGTHFIFEGSGGWTTMTAKETLNQINSTQSPNDVVLSLAEKENSTVIEIAGKYIGSVLARNVEMQIVQFTKWNPGFDKALAEGQIYPMRLTTQSAKLFEVKKNQILMESLKALLEGKTQLGK